MASHYDDEPPPSEDDVDTLEEEATADDASASVSEAATESVPQDAESSIDAAQPEPSSAEPNTSAMAKPVKKTKRRHANYSSVLSVDSRYELDPNNPPTPMMALKLPKQFEKFATKIKLQPASRVKGAVSAKAKDGPLNSTILTSCYQTKTKSVRGRSGGTEGDKETSKKSNKSKKSKKAKPVQVKGNSMKAAEGKFKGKSLRKPKPDAAVEVIKQIISDMTAPAKVPTTAPKPVNTRSILPEPKGRTKTKMKSYKAKAKAMVTTKGKDKSRFSKQTRGRTEATSPEPKEKPKRVSIKKPGQSADSSHPSPASKIAPEKPAMSEQMKTDPASLATKETINIVGKRSDDTREVFTKDEMEDLNDELSDLNTSINTLRHSYGSVIRSLANMQQRRAKKKAALAPVTHNTTDAEVQAPDGGTIGPTLTVEDICERRSVNYAQKFSLERFLDADSRDGAFVELFREVNQINSAMAPFKVFFDAEGYFQQAAYQAQDEFQLSRQQYNDCLKVIKDLAKAVITILKAYNTDLLDMFRISSQGN